MKTCIDCNSSINSTQSIRCVDCRILKRKLVAKANKDKHQYHKQPKFRYATYKRGAIRRGYVFELTLSEFELFWDASCSYCNNTIIGIGLDRIDNNIGYINTNVVPCCTTCNWMKHSMSQEMFINQCKKIVSVSLL